MANDDVAHAAAGDRNQKHGEEDARKGDHDLDRAHDDEVDPAAAQAGRQTERDADQAGDGHRREADDQDVRVP